MIKFQFDFNSASINATDRQQNNNIRQYISVTRPSGASQIESKNK